MKKALNIIQRKILEIDNSFNVSELLEKFSDIGINDKSAIITVLDNLLNNGYIVFSHCNENSIYYRSIFASKA